jgi:copper chaperone NosL
MLNKKSVWLQLAAALVLLLIFLFPIWRITLVAPQYPDGISLYIWLNKLTGDTPGTIQNINILNHYVGMQYIEADSFKELVYFPYIIISFCFLGIIAAISRRRWMVATWIIIMVIASCLGVYDFYLWLYDYGHNLSDTAPIKVPNQAYQPPLFGEKYLLNFLAKSYPSTGTAFYALGIALGSLAWWTSRKKNDD